MPIPSISRPITLVSYFLKLNHYPDSRTSSGARVRHTSTPEIYLDLEQDARENWSEQYELVEVRYSEDLYIVVLKEREHGATNDVRWTVTNHLLLGFF